MKAILTLREHQKRGIPETFLSEAVIREAMRIDWEHQEISFRALRKFATESYRKLGEANPGSAFSQLFRAGVQVVTNDWFQRTEVEYPKYVLEDPSNKRSEFHAPLFGSQFPTLTDAGDPYRENRIAGLDIELINQKYMGGESFTREMFDDDQTGQIKQRMRNLGESARNREELEVAGRLANVALTQGNATVPLSNYSYVNGSGNTVGVFDDNFYKTGRGNKLATFAQLSMAGIRTGIQYLKLAVDPLGVRIAVRPDVLVVSAFDDVNARTFLNSTFYPGVPGLAGQSASGATSGSATGVGADNVLKGMLDLCGNTYLPDGAWNMGVKKKGLVFQRRDPLEVVQEVPNSGASFNTDTMRFRSRGRWVNDWVWPGFWFQGNDGSASISQ